MTVPRRIGKRLLLTLAVSIALGAAYAGSNWNEVRPKLSYYKQRAFELDPRMGKALDEIAGHIRSRQHATESDRLDFVRDWVFRNSVHIEDDEWKRYAAKTHIVVPMLWRAHSHGETRPHLSCGPRAYAMKAILEALGMRSRVVDVFRVTEAGLADSHTFLEVWNKETGAWEIQDPDLNIAFRRIDSAARASVAQLVIGNIDEFEPVTQGRPGWRWGPEAPLRAYFNVAIYRLHYEGGRSKVLMNTKRIDPRTDIDGIVSTLKDRFYDPVILDTERVRL